MTDQGWSWGSPAGFISPHLDDVVLSCADVVAPGSLVVTVFASGPKHVDPLSSWDLQCGYFEPGDDVCAIRRAEDDEALSQLGAHGQRLEFWASQYRRPSHGAMARARARLRPGASDGELVRIQSELSELIRASGLSTWFIPLGVGHPDHRRTAAAALGVARELPELRWLLYEDLPYSRESAADVSDAHERLAAAGFAENELEHPTAAGSPRKLRAVGCYKSQLVGLGGRVDVAVHGPERCFALTATAS